MAKIAKPKKREVSVHSRAFRRNATPPPKISASKDKSEDNESWMYNAQNAGVHKKTKGKRGNTRQQHARQAKAMERADRNSAVLESKIAKSKVKGRRIVARAKDWDELNEELAATGKPEEKSKTVLEDPAMSSEEEEEEDVENTEPVKMDDSERYAMTTAAALEKIAEPVDVIT